MKNLRRKCINLVAGTYFCEAEEGKDHYDGYIKLTEVENKSDFANNHVYLWEQVQDWLVKTLIETIENEADQMETLIKSFTEGNPIAKIDFPMLREQKKSLVDVINHVDGGSELEGNLTGILHMIDDIQDYAVDTLGKDENDVHLQDEE